MDSNIVEEAEAAFKAATDCVCTDDFGIPLTLTGASLEERYKAVKFHLDLLFPDNKF